MDIKLLDEEALEGLRKNAPLFKVIENVYSYDMLANPKYMQQFQYTHISQRKSEQEMEQCDKARMVLSLAYVSEKKQADFNFMGGFAACIRGNIQGFKHLKSLRKKRRYSKSDVSGLLKNAIKEGDEGVGGLMGQMGLINN